MFSADRNLKFLIVKTPNNRMIGKPFQCRIKLYFLFNVANSNS